MKELKKYLKSNLKVKTKAELEDYIMLSYNYSLISEIELEKVFKWLEKKF